MCFIAARMLHCLWCPAGHLFVLDSFEGPSRPMVLQMQYTTCVGFVAGGALSLHLCRECQGNIVELGEHLLLVDLQMA
jgi:hypothetical protein